MKGDFSRQTFDPVRHYSGVRMQQGRVQLDADFNEQADIARHRTETGTLDVIGHCGAPLHDAGFALTAGGPGGAGDFLIGTGRYYVDGILCVCESDVAFSAQPDRRHVAPLDVTKVGFHVAYLDAWQRHLTALDAPHLRETALGGPDTTTRTHTTWQVRTVFAGAGPVDCGTDVGDYDDATAPATGALRARATPPPGTSGPCIVPAAAGYQGLENQLYRVEIHDAGTPYDLTAGGGDAAVTALPDATHVVYGAGAWSAGDAIEVFTAAAGADPIAGSLAWVVANDAATKTLTLNASLPAIDLADQPRIRHVQATYAWSRDNGSMVSLVKTVDGADLVVHSLGVDHVLGFAPGQWVELIDDARELEGVPGELAQIASIAPATNTITLLATPSFPGDIAAEDPDRHLKLRRWDGAAALKTAAPAPSEGYAALEDGVEVRAEAGTYRTGDFWLIPARTATADAQSGRIEWADDAGKPAALPAFGIDHRYCRIAVLQSDGAKLSVAADCRHVFPPLTDASLVYVGGDGQEAVPGQPLPQLLEAGVFRGTVPVAGATVTFTTAAGGRLADTVAGAPGGGAAFPATTGADGIARAGWLPDPAGPDSQQAIAALLDEDGAALAPPLHYSGSLSLASEVAYVPGACADLKDASTVQEALDILCKRPSGGGCAVVVPPDQRVDELIKTLQSDGHTDLCLCLMAGDHELPDGLTVEGDLGLELCGCEAGTRVKAGGPVRLSGLRTAVLSDLDLLLATGAPLEFDRCDAVELLSCRVLRDAAGVASVIIAGAERIRLIDDVLDGHAPGVKGVVPQIAGLLKLTDRRAYAREAARLAEKLGADEGARAELLQLIDKARPRIDKLSVEEREAYAGVGRALAAAAPAITQLGWLLAVFDATAGARAHAALVLTDGGAETEIAECRLIGPLVLYGEPGDAIVTPDRAQGISAAHKDGRLTLDVAAGTLHIRDCALTQITVGAAMSRLLIDPPADRFALSGVFRRALLTDNVLTQPAHALVAGHASLTGNDFDEHTDDVGIVIADSAIYTANHAPNDFRLFAASQVTAVAANLTINIVTM
jgi:hypothetical protein